ncbi:Arsenate reductase [hydrothermal vent metagenome]|uniref:Arsenate reductase n=1 Tax=hydrothermal vent metagenome TaxID=652676 RepID=A0A3B0VDX1_9ZZZZ
MAEGFAKTLALQGANISVMSAGTGASGIVNGDTIRVMKEAGIDISANTSDRLTDELIAASDIVVTLGCCCASELCPCNYKGVTLDWEVEDPMGQPWEVMQRVRDDIEDRVRRLVEGL